MVNRGDTIWFINAPATFERVTKNVLKGFSLKIWLVYLKYIIVGMSFDNHIELLEEVLQRLRGANVNISQRNIVSSGKKFDTLDNWTLIRNTALETVIIIMQMLYQLDFDRKTIDTAEASRRRILREV